eukprot:808107-Prymnesium_polylepis.1
MEPKLQRRRRGTLALRSSASLFGFPHHLGRATSSLMSTARGPQQRAGWAVRHDYSPWPRLARRAHARASP